MTIFTAAAVMMAICWPVMEAQAAPAVPATAPASQPAKDANAHQWAPKVTSVAVFKNGLGFFLREGEVELRDGWCVSKEVPPATFGTLAIFAHAADQTVDIVGSGPGEVVEFDGVDAPKDVEAKRGRINSYMNLNVQLTYKHDSTDRLAAGKVRQADGKFVILESDSNNFAVPIDEVTKLQLLELPIRAHVIAEGNKVPTKAKLGMGYLRKGITWIPEYTLKVLDDETAEISLRGVLVNEAEDLVHADVNFVVGVPHFAHTEYVEPISVGQIIRTIGSAVAPAQISSQIMNSAAMVSNIAPRSMEVVAQPVGAAPANLGSALGSLPAMEATSAATDYTVYTKKDLTVRRGEKAIVTLFRNKIKYSHIYRWNLPGQMEHLLVLNNSTDTAWTTGPCLVVSGDRPLGEDILKYVPKGSQGEMPVTAAINIAQEKSETESGRKMKDYMVSKDNYLDLVTITGKVQLKNFEKRPVTIVVTVPVPGKPLEASDEGAITVDTSKLQILERSGSVKWRVTLEPGASKTMTYSYERYVPSR